MSTSTVDPAHEPPKDPQEAATPAPPADPPQDGAQPPADPPEGGNSEAAKYRRRLRDTEAERDAHAARIEAFQRRDVARLAGESLAQPEDLFDVGGRDLADLLDDSGEVDPEKVSLASAALLESRPGLAKTKEQPWPGLGQGRVGESVASGASWAGLLSGK